MPAQEVGGLLLLKWVGGIIATTFIGLFGWLFKKTNDTYTKQETEHLIDLKIQPLVNSIDNSTEVNKEQTATMKELNKTLQDLNTSVEVVKNEVSHIKTNL